MDSVFVVEQWSYDPQEVFGVFNTRQAAERALLLDGYTIKPDDGSPDDVRELWTKPEKSLLAEIRLFKVQ